MSDTSYTAFFGDGTYTFRLTGAMIVELESKVASGIGALFQRAVSRSFKHADLTETIRCALIGGGTSPTEAARLVSIYAVERPLGEVLDIVLGILDATWNGTPEPVIPALSSFHVALEEDAAAKAAFLATVRHQPTPGPAFLDMDAIIAAEKAAA